MRAEAELKKMEGDLAQIQCEETECHIPGGPAGQIMEALDAMLRWCMGSTDDNPLDY